MKRFGPIREFLDIGIKALLGNLIRTFAYLNLNHYHRERCGLMQHAVCPILMKEILLNFMFFGSSR